MTAAPTPLSERWTWKLECLDGAVPCELCPDGGVIAGPGEEQTARLRVGRTAHTERLWERLLPEDAVRHTVSREQFEIIGDSPDDALGSVATSCVMRNLSSRGTFLNGTIIQDQMALVSGDLIGVGQVTSEYGSRPALHFRFLAVRTHSPTATLAPPGHDPGEVALAAASYEPIGGSLEWLPLPPPPPLTGSPLARECVREVATAPAMPAESVAVEDVPSQEFAPLRAPPPAAPAAPQECCLVCTGCREKPVTVATLPIYFTRGSCTGVLRVGRAHQEPMFWESLVPDEKLRSCVSREHFEIYVEVAPSNGHSTGDGVLMNLSASGTLLNGRLVRESCRLRSCDVIGVPQLQRASIGSPIVEFRLWVGDAEPPRASAKEARTPREETQTCPGSTHDDSANMSSSAGEDVGDSDVLLPVEPGPAHAMPANKEGSSSCSARGDGAPVAVPAVEESFDFICIAPSSLPPPFKLRCTQTRGLLDRELDWIPREERTLEADCSSARLRVGRAIQPSHFWEALLPQEELRNTVSREHFELTFSDDGLHLTNLSNFSTIVNNQFVTEQIRVRDGDTIAIRATPWCDSVPTIVFRLSVAESLCESGPCSGVAAVCNTDSSTPRPPCAPRQPGSAFSSCSFNVSADSGQDMPMSAGYDSIGHRAADNKLWAATRGAGA